MSNQNSVIVMFLVLLVVALLEGNMLNIVMVITVGFVTLVVKGWGLMILEIIVLGILASIIIFQMLAMYALKQFEKSPNIYCIITTECHPPSF